MLKSLLITLLFSALAAVMSYLLADIMNFTSPVMAQFGLPDLIEMARSYLADLQRMVDAIVPGITA